MSIFDADFRIRFLTPTFDADADFLTPTFDADFRRQFSTPIFDADADADFRR